MKVHIAATLETRWELTRLPFAFKCTFDDFAEGPHHFLPVDETVLIRIDFVEVCFQRFRRFLFAELSVAVFVGFFELLNRRQDGFANLGQRLSYLFLVNEAIAVGVDAVECRAKLLGDFVQTQLAVPFLSAFLSCSPKFFKIACRMTT